ncbi:MAG: S-layer homology domain-containing protein [Elainellaceae cyanobacterium]
MTQSVPPDPQNRNERHDELIAAVLAIAAVGGILFWGLTRGGDRPSIASLGNDVVSSVTGADETDAALDSTGARSSMVGRDSDSDSEEVSGDDLGSRFNALLGGAFSGGGEPPTQRTSSRDGGSRDAARQARDAEVDRLTGNAGAIALPNTPQAASPESELGEETELGAETDGSDSSVETPAGSTEANGEANGESDTLPPPTDFTDIGADYWAKSYIDKMSQLGVLEGFPEGDFRPDANVTRAEFASSLRRAFADAGDAASIEYSDITPDYWAKDAIDHAAQLNFMSGYPDESFQPNSPVTRLEVIIALSTGLGLDLPDNPDAILDTYSDRDQIPNWAVEKIAAATASGLVISHPDVNRFEPNVPATRAESAAMIYLALANQNNLADIPSYYRVDP